MEKAMSVKTIAGFLLSLSFCVASGDLKAAGRVGEVDEWAKVFAEQVCASCHGAHGSSKFSEIPSLAAQSQVYLVAKLEQFRNQALKRPNRHIDLLGITLNDEATVEALAQYFAKQSPPPPVTRDATAVAAGSKIFSDGIETKGVAACAVCHGTNAEGFWIVPRLAGQHAGYVERQLKAIQLQLRDAPGMHAMVKDLSLEEIKAVAAFIQSK